MNIKRLRAGKEGQVNGSDTTEVPIERNHEANEKLARHRVQGKRPAGGAASCTPYDRDTRA